MRYVWILSLAAILLIGCGQSDSGTYQGYVEGEFVYRASPLGGRLDEAAVKEGDSVRAGDLLFRLDDDLESAAVKEAERRLEASEKHLADLQKGARPSEVRAIEARLGQARAVLKLSEAEYERRRKLARTKTISLEQLDVARTSYERDRDLVAQIQAELTTARLGGREDAIKAAEADVGAARARVDQAHWNRDQKTQSARQDALVFDVIYRPGEYVPPGRPVVSLLPPSNIEVRFFVPQTELSRLALGNEVRVLVDGRSDPISARVSYISPQAEYTPPVIYSRETRAKLVFLVKARPAPEFIEYLHPGQPVDVALAGSSE
jgi:HlyD family secretion protein